MSNHEPIAQACPLFADLTQSQLLAVLERLTPSSYEAGEDIYSEGDSRQQLAIIAHGRVEVVKQKPDGTLRQLAELEAGTVFGEMSFFHAAPHSATVRATERTEIVGLTRTSYDDLREAAPAAAHLVAVNTVKLLADRLRRMDEWVFELLDRPESCDSRQEWKDFRAKLYTDWQF